MSGGIEASIEVKHSRLAANVSYDGEADVLYITFSGLEASHHVPCDRELIFGVSESGELCGLTLIDASQLLKESAGPLKDLVDALLGRLRGHGVEGVWVECVKSTNRFPGEVELAWWSLDLSTVAGGPLKLELGDYRLAEKLHECSRCGRPVRCLRLVSTLAPARISSGRPVLLDIAEGLKVLEGVDADRLGRSLVWEVLRGLSGGLREAVVERLLKVKVVAGRLPPSEFKALFDALRSGALAMGLRDPASRMALWQEVRGWARRGSRS